MTLHEVLASKVEKKARKRVGRGIGSGKGKTCGRGHKGQKSRSGVSIKGFEGGQMPIHRRLPKRGFSNIFRQEVEILNLKDIQEAIDSGKIKANAINSEALAEAGLVKSGLAVKILASGEIAKAIEVNVNFISKVAQEKIEKAGGKVTLS